MDRSAESLVILATLLARWKVLWQPLVTKLIVSQVINLLVEYHCGDHKRTQQEVPVVLLPYLYKLQVVHANTNLILS